MPPGGPKAKGVHSCSYACFSKDVNLALMNGTLEDTMRGTSSAALELINKCCLQGIKDIPGVGKVLQKTTDDSTWVLLMKLSKNDFCYGSRRWTDGQAFNANKMLDTSIPASEMLLIDISSCSGSSDTFSVRYFAARQKRSCSRRIVRFIVFG